MGERHRFEVGGADTGCRVESLLGALQHVADLAVETLPPDLRQRDRLITIRQRRTVAADQIGGRPLADHRHAALVGRQRSGQLPGEVLDTGERTKRVRPEQRRTRRIGTEEQRRRSAEHPVDDREVQRDVVASESPAPRALRRRCAEEPHVVHQRISSTWPFERGGEALELIEHVLEPDDRRRRHVSGCREPAGNEPEQQAMLRLRHRRQRQPAVVGWCVEPSASLVVGRERPQRHRSLRVVERVDQPRGLVGHRGRHAYTCRRCRFIHQSLPWTM